MSTTAVKKGGRYTYVNNGSAIASGQVVVLVSGSSGFVGVALTSIANGASGQLMIGGPDERVHQLTKHSGEAFTDAQQLYWDASNSRLTGSSTGNTKAGRSYGTFASSATTAWVILNG